MNKITIYGSKHCPDCVTMKEYLSSNNVEYIYLDITESMLYLKMFLKHRDFRPEFEEIKKANRVGIPCIMINKEEKFLFEEPGFDLEKLK